MPAFRRYARECVGNSVGARECVRSASPYSFASVAFHRYARELVLSVPECCRGWIPLLDELALDLNESLKRKLSIQGPIGLDRLSGRRMLRSYSFGVLVCSPLRAM